MAKPGERVAAILSSNDGVVEFIGYGVYVGDYVTHEKVAGFMAHIARETGRVNPKIVLDNGKDVFGCECWWGPEASVRQMLESEKNVIEVDIDLIRKKLAKETSITE